MSKFYNRTPRIFFICSSLVVCSDELNPPTSSSQYLHSLLSSKHFSKQKISTASEIWNRIGLNKPASIIERALKISEEKLDGDISSVKDT